MQFQSWASENQEALGDEYQAIHDNAEVTLWSIQWAEDVSSDLDDYFDGDDMVFTTSTPGTTTTEEIITETPGSLLEPTTPTFPPSAAVSTVVSLLLLSLGVIVHTFF